MKEKEQRFRKWVLTINNPQEHQISHESIKEALRSYAVKYFAIGDEIGGQGTYHYHVFLYFSNAIRFSSIKKLFPTANIQQARGTPAQIRSYLLKDAPEHNKLEDGTYSYVDSSGKEHKGKNRSECFEETGDLPTEHQGKRNDLEYMYSLIKEGYSTAEIIEQCGSTAILHVNKINTLRFSYLAEEYRTKRRLNLKVHYISGNTGLGKSRDILDQYGDENVYRVTDYQHPFDSYQYENIIVFEEYRSQLCLSEMLNYLDVYPITLPARYSPKIACYETVFIVSNWAFEEQYYEFRRDPAQKSSYDAFKRRINGEIRVYKETGITVYKSLDEYLQRDRGFRPLSASEEKELPFD